MRSRNKLVTGIVAAVVAAAAFVTAGGVTGANAGKPAAVAGRSVDLGSILLPPEQHPAGSTILLTTTLKNASAQVLPGTGEPSGVVVMPRCMSYFAVLNGGLGSLDGAYQFGARADGTIFVHFVAKVPSRDAVDLIRLRIAACHEGLMTIQGWPPSAVRGGRSADGTLSFTDRPTPALAGAKTYGITQTVTFHRPRDPLAKQVRQAWSCTNRPCASPIVFVEKGGLLIWVLDAYADQMAKALFDRSQK